MVDPAKGVFLLPTRRRIEKLKKFLHAAEATKRSTRIVLLVDHAEIDEYVHAYEELCRTFPKLGFVVTHAELDGAAAKVQWAYENWVTKDREWVGFLADDILPQTAHWDRILISQLNGYNFVTCDDGWQAPARTGSAVVWSGDLLRAVGYIAPPGMSHLYLDDIWETLGRDLPAVWTYEPSVLIEHKHAGLEAKPIDSTSETQAAFWAGDEKAYRIWRRAERRAASKRIETLMRTNGVEFLNTDLTGVRLLVTTPIPGMELDARFVDWLWNLRALVEACGGEFDFFKLTGCSDIVYGRAVLFTSFVNSDFTLNLMSDSDMVAKPMDVVRMILRMRDQKLPFLAVAGPRKGDGKMVFAATCADDLGRTRPGTITPDGIVEVTEVGGAFVMVDRSFADRMTHSYGEGALGLNPLDQDVRFKDAIGRVHYGLWLPGIANMRYRAEDYSMCARWRAIGGKVLVDATIPLGHSGTKTWTGAFIDQINEAQEEIAERQREAAE